MHIAEVNVQAWLEESKLEVGSLNIELEAQITSEVLGRISRAGYDVLSWTDSTTTPKLVKKIISMLYAGWFYDRAYSETADTNQYAQRLKKAAETLILGIIGGTIDIEEVTGDELFGDPLFFPNDQSTAMMPDEFEVGDGPSVFGMGAKF